VIGTNVSPTGVQRWGRNARRLPLLVLLLLGIGTATACESTAQDRGEVIALVNASRAKAGLPALREHPVLSLKADAWARHLRDICDLEHSKLSDGAPDEWLKLGENVGYGGTISQIHEAYLNSPGHRANIMDPAYTSMGAAAVYGTCNGQTRVFTVQEFMKS